MAITPIVVTIQCLSLRSAPVIGPQAQKASAAAATATEAAQLLLLAVVAQAALGSQLIACELLAWLHSCPFLALQAAFLQAAAQQLQLLRQDDLLAAGGRRPLP